MKKKAWDMCSKYVRLRDAIRTTRTATHAACYTCGRIHPVKELQAGHLVPGRGNSVLFVDAAIRAQCVQCNILKHGQSLIFRSHLVCELGEDAVKAFEDLKWIPKSYSITELEALYYYYKDRYEALMKGYNT